jgi:hypothetical protein
LNLLVMAKHFLPQSSNLRQNLGRNKWTRFFSIY